MRVSLDRIAQPFVVFSESNPFLPELEQATAAYLRKPHGLVALVV